jgi:retron-type reverse transcriptase
MLALVISNLKVINIRLNYCLDMDIKECFPSIDHSDLLTKIGKDFPAIDLIKRWCKAGYMDKGVNYDTPTVSLLSASCSPKKN